MDFFQDYVTFGNSHYYYRCHLSFDQRSVLIPFSGSPCNGLFLSTHLVINGHSFKILHFSIEESMGYGGKDKILKLAISREHCD